MTHTAINPFANPDLPSLADLLSMVTNDADFTPRRRAELASAIRKTASWFGLALSEIPAAPAFLRVRFQRLSPGGVGVSRKCLQNVRSGVNFALRRYGLGGNQAYLAPLTGTWKDLAGRMNDSYQKVPLTRFFRFLSATNVAPKEVSDSHSLAFLKALERESIFKNPKTSHQNMCRAWNRAVDEIDGWPQVRLTVPRYRHPWALRWDAFPSSFNTDVDNFCLRQSGVEFFADGPPRSLAESTINTRRNHLRCAASTLVHRGIAVEDIVDLTFLCRPENVESALQFYIDRNGNTANEYLGQIAYSLRTVALYHAKLTPDEQKRVVWLYKRVVARIIDRPDRDLALLRWFDDEDNVLRFMAFPTEQMDVVDAINNPTRADALRYQWAMAVELLTFAEVRIENFTTLHLEKHFTWHDDVLIIAIERSEVKNRQDIKSEIPGPVAAHVSDYLERYQPLIAGGPSSWLFPGRNGGPKSANTLRFQMERTTFEAVGIALHPHIFRKIGPKIFLDRRPGQYDVVSRKLANKPGTTFSNYTGAETAAALRHFDAVLLDLYEEANPPRSSKPKRKRRK